MTLVFYIDAEIHRQNAEEKLAVEYRSILGQRSSPVPSSASAMFKEELQRERTAIRKENPDERSLESLRKKQKPAEPSIPLK